MVASSVPPTEDLANNPGMFPDWESNWRPFGSKTITQYTEPHQPGLLIYFLIYVCLETKLIIVFQGIILQMDIIIIAF